MNDNSRRHNKRGKNAEKEISEILKNLTEKTNATIKDIKILEKAHLIGEQREYDVFISFYL